MTTQTTNLVLIEDLGDVGRRGELAEVISDWKFFLDKEKWLSLWARRYRESAVHALADELRRLPWRASGANDRAEV